MGGSLTVGKAEPPRSPAPPRPRCCPRPLLWALPCEHPPPPELQAGPLPQRPGPRCPSLSALVAFSATVCLLCPLPQGQRPRPAVAGSPACTRGLAHGPLACVGASVEPACGQPVAECRPSRLTLCGSTLGVLSFLSTTLICSSVVTNLVHAQRGEFGKYWEV